MEVPAKAPEKSDRLSMMTKLSYGLGDIYGGGANTLVSMYYLVFLTDVMKISPALAGTAFLISKTWAAATDPVMGVISDNTKSRFGRRRPYFLAGIPLVFLSFVLMWVPLSYPSEAARFLYVVFVNIFFATIFTMVWVPYNALAPDLTSDYHERTKLATWRMIFSNISGILAGMLGRDFFVTTLYPDAPQQGFLLMAVVFGLFFALPYILTFRYCRETPHTQNAPSFQWNGIRGIVQAYIKEPFALRPFSALAAMFVFSFMAQDAVLAMAVYFLTCYLKMRSMMTLLVPTYLAVMAAIPIAEFASKNIGKKHTFLGACAFWLLAFAMIPFMKPGNFPMLYLFGALFGTAVGGIQVMLFAMIPDVPDADELFSRLRREGLFMGILATLRKTGGALVIFLIGCGIQWAGYVPPEANVPQPQSPTFLAALFAMFIGIPLLFLLLAMAACFRYPLSQDCHTRLKAILAAKANRETLSDEEKQEETHLREILGPNL